MMDRFLSNTINGIDKKGRISIPAPFRSLLSRHGDQSLFTLLAVDQPAIDAGGRALLDGHEGRIADMDPLSQEYELWSFHLHGDSQELRIDGDGRVVLSEDMRVHTGITNQAAFVGRGHFFQIWQPERFRDYQARAREQVRAMRRQLGKPIPQQEGAAQT